MSIVMRLRRNRTLRALSTVDKCTCTCARIPISPLSSDHRQEVEVVVLLLSCCLYEYHGIVFFIYYEFGLLAHAHGARGESSISPGAPRQVDQDDSLD